MKIAVTQRYKVNEYKMADWILTDANKKMFSNNGIVLIQVNDLLNVDEVVKECDGLFVPGGADIDPALYGEEINGTKDFYRFMDDLDFTYIKAFHKANKPILGICRGHQVINVVFGGTLYQDIQGHSDGWHNVKIEKDSFVDNIYHLDHMEVNSWHHQAVKDVAPGFKVVAVSDDGTIEALEKDNIYTVQWHPELYDGDNYISYFINNVFKK